MTTFTGKLAFVNLAAAGKKSDSIVIETSDGKQQRLYLKAGDAGSLTKHRGSIVSAEADGRKAPDGNMFYWTTPDKIAVTGGGKQTSQSAPSLTDVDRNLSINYQSARKDAILALTHNNGGKKVTPEMIHEFTLELTRFAMDRELAKEVFKTKKEGSIDDENDDFELNELAG